MKTDQAELDRRAAAREGKARVYPVTHVKMLGDDAAPGTFEALVAVMGNIDSYGDRIVPGFFDDAIKAYGIPAVVWSHDWLTPPIGVGEEAREVSKAEAEELAGKSLPDIPDGDLGGALYTRSRLFVAEGTDVPIAKHIWTAMSELDGNGQPPLREFSFGFRTAASRWVEEDVDTLPPELQWTGGEIRELVKARRVYEYGPTLVGANPATELLAVKAAIGDLEARGLLSSDDATKMLRRVENTTTPPEAPEPPAAKAAELSEDVRAMLDAADVFPDPRALSPTNP